VGDLVQSRVVRYAAERWKRTYQNVDPSQGEKDQLYKTIRRLQYLELPRPGDPEIAMLPLADVTNFRHVIKGTSLSLLYNFQDEPDPALFLISLHRFVA
jgi:hypothetical protein